LSVNEDGLNNPSAGNLAAWGTLSDNAGRAAVAQVSANDGKWHSAIATWRSGTTTLYFDGVEVASNNQLTSISQTTNSFLIGKYNDINGGSTGTIGQFLGQIDDVRIFSRILTPPEIRLLASKRGIGLQPRPKQYTYYQFPSGSKRRRLLTGMP
jgi:hypothetical protein